MNDQQRITYLRSALRVFGAIMVFAFYPLTIVWPAMSSRYRRAILLVSEYAQIQA